MLESVPTDVQALIGLGVLAMILTGAIIFMHRHAKRSAHPPHRIERFLRTDEDDIVAEDDDNDDPSSHRPY
jgi:predicted DNA repair protein MutK